MLESGSHHSFYDKLMKKAAEFNNGHKLGLLYITDARMAFRFYHIHCCIQHRSALIATTHTPMWGRAIKTDRPWKAVVDIEIF